MKQLVARLKAFCALLVSIGAGALLLCIGLWFIEKATLWDEYIAQNRCFACGASPAIPVKKYQNQGFENNYRVCKEHDIWWNHLFYGTTTVVVNYNDAPLGLGPILKWPIRVLALIGWGIGLLFCVLFCGVSIKEMIVPSKSDA